jgi:hypothetical protein
MVKEFLNLNKHKLWFFPAVLWTILFVCITIASQLFPGGGPRVSWLKGLEIAVLYATFLTFIIVIVSFLICMMRFIRKRVIFKQENWSEFFYRHHFKRTLINYESKMALTEEVMQGKVKDFEVVADTFKDESKFLQFRFYVEWVKLDKTEFKRLDELFKDYDAELDIGYISMKIPNTKRLPVYEIEDKLGGFADLLKQEKFRPLHFTDPVNF